MMADSQQSFCKLYQSLIEKKKRIEALELINKAVKADSANRVIEVENKCGQALAEAEKGRVTSMFIKSENARLKEDIDSLKTEKVRLREAGLLAEAEVKRRGKDIELAESRLEMVQRENILMCRIIVTYSEDEG